jgi:hypothetical protein
MHAVVTHVSLNDSEVAASGLETQLIPQLRQTPGFVSAVFVALDGDKGVSIVVWESEEAARGAAERVQPPNDAVRIETVEVGQVAARA